MSKLVGTSIPPEIRQAFDGEELERKIGPAYLLVTTDGDGTPRPCMLSAGETLVLDERTLRVALWPKSRTSANLERGSRVLLCFVEPGAVLYLRGRPRALGTAAGSPLERFEIEVESVESDAHEGMPVTSGITFAVERGDPAAVAEAWAEQVASLRAD